MREWAATCTRKMEKSSSNLAQPLEKPGAGQGPEAIGGASANPQRVRGLLVAHAGEVAELDELRGRLVVPLQLGEGLVEGQREVGPAVDVRRDVVDVEPAESSPGLLGRLASGAVRRGCAAWPLRRRRRSGPGRARAGRVRPPPVGGTPRGPVRWAGASAPAARGPASMRPAAAARRTPAAGGRGPNAPRPARARPGSR